MTLNAQQHSSDGARFDWFVPPTISSVYPLHGPNAGGTRILLTGINFQHFGKDRVAGSVWPAQSASVWPEAKHDLRCRFGPSVLTPTTFVTHESVACLSPPVSALGAAGSLTFTFDRPHLNATALMGSAVIQDGVLVLTHARPYQVGSFAVRPHLYVETPIRSFDASFEVLIAGGNASHHDPAQISGWSRGFEPLAGMGVAFCYSNVDGEASAGLAFGELGPEPARGLRVSLLGYTTRAIEVAYDGVILLKVPLESNLRTLSWTAMRIRFVDERVDSYTGETGAPRGGPGGRLSVWYDNILRVDDLNIANWGATADWSWSLSASTTDVTDAHWVDNLVITSSNLTTAEPFPFRDPRSGHLTGASHPIALTLNRREYYEPNQVEVSRLRNEFAIHRARAAAALQRKRLNTHGRRKRQCLATRLSHT